ncbi:ead/Ea22-like family protein [Klebsiella pneumoniae]|nr:ead/Ea22-like family protein [Klebsiella pneumoniae]HBT4652908.1 ead/Ea22-like family protein [Klebsiella pneumoniae]HBT4698185.1 ead/Ea22-like family protein [Klebsiella pneumoniae]HBZ0993743.1 ead/Ea22-like family protein [Klebsiella pneumoniae]HCI5815428.1 ead/Ea22-like family protein [Klebsiella pneumoniae]
MTDITELAQQLKAAAEKATPGEWVYFPKNTSIEYDVGSDESQGSILYVDSGDFTQAQTDRNGEFIALANPANILALVEALEKAQQRITQMESRTVTDWIEHDGKWRPESLGLDELVYLKTRKQELKIPYPAGKVKGWMNTGGDMDVMAYKLASPQASTVTVKLPNQTEFDDPLSAYEAIERCKDALAAAGIKVEAE